MGRSRRESEDHSASKKRSTRSKETPSPRRGSTDRSRNYLQIISHSILDRKRDEKREDKKTSSSHDLRSRHRSPSENKSIDSEVKVNGSMAIVADEPGNYENFPEIHPKTVEGLKKRGINFLFPVQYESFNTIFQRKDLIVRDLTGSGKTLGFSLPMVEYLRKHKCFGTGKTQGIVLAPTRELALQVSKEINLLKHYDNEYNVLTVYGGVSIED